MPPVNVLLIVADELAATALSCAGNPVVKTPNIDRLAESGIRFDQAYCTTPLCTPSRISMFTGLFPNAHQSFFVDEASHLAPGGPNLISTLHEQGYRTALIGKNHAFTESFLDTQFDHVEEYLHWGKCRGEIRPSDKAVWDWRHQDPRPRFAKFNSEGCILGEGLIEEAEPFQPEECMTGRIAEDMENFLSKQGEQPFFLHYSFPDPHWPLTVCEPYYSMYSEEQIDTLPGFHEIDWNTHPFKHFIQSKAAGFDEYSESDRKRQLAIYYGMVSFIDDAVGRLYKSLEENNLLDNTLLLFTSDHGAFAGQYGLLGKTGGFYDCLMKIPLLAAGPGVKAGAVSDAMISNADITPTILDLLGIPIYPACQGYSFAHLLKVPTAEHRQEIFAEVGIPVTPPDPFPPETYATEDAERTEERGWFWFVDYTTRGRSAMVRRRDGWKYCYNHADKEELYHLAEDPVELTNLADDPECRAIKDQLKSQLMEWLLVEPHRRPWENRSLNTL